MAESLIQNPLAIVGMACRLPGADNLSEFWTLLDEGRSGTGRFPEHRLNRSLYFDERKGQVGKTYTDLGGLIRERPFDPSLMPWDESQRKSFDASHLIFAEVAAAAVRDAGWATNELPNSRIGVYVGHSGGTRSGGDLQLATMAEQTADLLNELSSFQTLDQRDRDRIVQEFTAALRSGKPRRETRQNYFFEANRAARLTSQLLGFIGPSFVVDAACASSLVALSLAAIDLQLGLTDAAIVGGASYNKADNLVLFSFAQSCSATGSRPFDEDADGLISAEGYVAIVLKPLEAALRSGDRVWAVLRGLGMSSDGKGKSLWAPRREGQATAMRRAYHDGIQPDQVQYVEAHATSTQVGDATEMEALADFFQPVLKKKIPVGSVKANLGHTLETAGLAGLLKTILSMHHGRIPPNIGVSKPNSTIPWNQIPFRLPLQREPWEVPAGRPRCAAVNAFGIGGLNVHLVVEHFSAEYHKGLLTVPTEPHSRRELQTASRPNTQFKNDEPIAIVGRGIIVPGADGFDAFSQLLRSGRSCLVDAPAERWRKHIGVEAQAQLPWRVPCALGGFLTNYQYDWRKHKVPPKQVERANPLQFMLLDAAGQAIDDYQKQIERLPREKTAVVVGTIFGGEFGTQLQLGLRLPEIRCDLNRLLEASAPNCAVRQSILSEFETKFLAANRALLDETGSFTSSTLASRITKQFNLMGGAMAIDAGEASGLNALQASCGMLRVGAADAVICAAGLRSMDLSTYEALFSLGRLDANSMPPKLPGEGVVVFLLKRLSDARRDGDQVYGTIRQVSNWYGKVDPNRAYSYLQSEVNASQRVPAPVEIVVGLENGSLSKFEHARFTRDFPGAQLQTAKHIAQIGDLKGAKGHVTLMERLATTGSKSAKNERMIFLSEDDDVCVVDYGIGSVDENRIHPQNLENAEESSHDTKAIAKPHPLQERASEPSMTSSSQGQKRVPNQAQLMPIARLHLHSDSAEGLRLAASDIRQARHRMLKPPSKESGPFQAIIVARGEDELQDRLKLLADSSLDQLHRLTVKGIFVKEPTANNQRSIVAVYPGQGSQSGKLVETWTHFSLDAKNALEEANAILQHLGSPVFDELLKMAGGSASSTWPTQACMLVAEYVLMRALPMRSIPWHAAVGHSLGELGAMMAAQCWDLAAALRFVQARAAAVDRIPNRGGLVSVASDAESVRGLLATYPAPIWLTHVNGPKQVVFGGALDELKQWSEAMMKKGIAATALAVPAAFHTPMMGAAQVELSPHARQAPIAPPVFPFFSTISNKYVADPNEIRRGLIEQLTTPVLYRDAIERLYQDGGRAFVEIGPGQVLTNLNRAILADRNVTLWSLERADGDCERSLAELNAILELFGVAPATSAGDISEHHSAFQNSQLRPNLQPIVLDATQRRRQRLRERATVQARSGPLHEIPQPMDDDHSSRVGSLASVLPPQGSPGTTACDPVTAKSTKVSMNQNSAGIFSDAQSLEAFLRDFIVEQTGYPPDMIELDWDLEADLGIDSIKQAQLYGELRAMIEFDVQPLLDGKVRTLRQMIEFLGQSALGHATNQQDSSTAEPDQPIVIESVLTNHGETTPTALDVLSNPLEAESTLVKTLLPTPHANREPVAPLDPTHHLVAASADTLDCSTFDLSSSTERWKVVPEAELTKFLVDFVVDHTGYPPDIVELDADFEADLGLDSIKLAQLFGEMRNHYHLAIELSDRETLAQCRTLNHIIGLFASDRAPQQAEPCQPIETAPRTSQSNGSAEMASGETSALQVDRTPEYREAYQWAQENGHHLWNFLTHHADHKPTVEQHHGTLTATEELPPPTQNRLRGLADGSGMSIVNIAPILLRSSFIEDWTQFIRCVESAPPVQVRETEVGSEESNGSASKDVCRRFVLRLHPARKASRWFAKPEWTGAAVVLGSNAHADAMVSQLNRDGVACLKLESALPLSEAIEKFDRFSAQHPVHHWFIASARDTAASTQFEPTWWQLRKSSGFRSIFYLSQRWYERALAGKFAEQTTLVALAGLGGSFGLEDKIIAVESGGISGLLKALQIEFWVNGYTALPIKIIDLPPDANPQQGVRIAWQELANSSYENEITYRNDERMTVRIFPKQLQVATPKVYTRGGNWILTGGARGITQFTARKIAQRYGVHVHLIGKTPCQQPQANWHPQSEEELRQFKVKFMDQARQRGENVLQSWQQQEKVLQIQKNLWELQQAGIEAHYHSCDVKDFAALEKVIESIRRDFGPITGVVHGAGAGQDARFDRKRPDKVEECLGPKIEGTINLMYLTMHDPLECFVGFGSISGRFGANGNSDYAAANEMLAKIVDWYRDIRPEVPATTFHWHAWDDVGMATKPGTRLGLELVDMQFMPAREGAKHLIRELDAGLPEREILITDNRYYRVFVPAETRVRETNGSARVVHHRSLLCNPSEAIDAKTTRDSCVLDPKKETFLLEHCFQDRPLLPVVVGLELLIEPALGALRLEDWRSKNRPVHFKSIEVLRGLRFFDDRPLTVEVIRQIIDANRCSVVLRSDFHARNGTLVEKSRPYMKAEVANLAHRESLDWNVPDINSLPWERVRYPEKNPAFYVGPSFQALKKACVYGDRSYGFILAPSLVHLAGLHREIEGWNIPCAALDACLFSTGILAWKHVRQGISLPVGFGDLVFHGLPQPGETCLVESRWKRTEGRHAWFDFRMTTSDNTVLIEAMNYQISWLES